MTVPQLAKILTNSGHHTPENLEASVRSALYAEIKANGETRFTRPGRGLFALGSLAKQEPAATASNAGEPAAEQPASEPAAKQPEKVEDIGYIYIFTNPALGGAWSKVVGSRTPVNLTGEIVCDPHLPVPYKPFAALKTKHYLKSYPQFIEAAKRADESGCEYSQGFVKAPGFRVFRELRAVASRFGEVDGIYCADERAARELSGRFELRKPHQPPEDGSIELYVGNLNYEVTMVQLKELFGKYGEVNDVRIVTNRFNGKSKGYAFVHMPNREEAEKAVAAINHMMHMGREIVCNEAKNVVASAVEGECGNEPEESDSEHETKNEEQKNA